MDYSVKITNGEAMPLCDNKPVKWDACPKHIRDWMIVRLLISEDGLFYYSKDLKELT